MKASREFKLGFTIIEVTLVLAIAGLIFLMVFVALPALQRSQRDTQRKNDIARLMSAINSYKSNNRGKILWRVGVTASGDSLANKYLNKDKGEWIDPTGKTYNISVNNASVMTGNGIEGWGHPGYHHYYRRADGHEKSNFIFIFIGYKCRGANVTRDTNDNGYTIQYALESGDSVCIDD